MERKGKIIPVKEKYINIYKLFYKYIKNVKPEDQLLKEASMQFKRQKIYKSSITKIICKRVNMKMWNVTSKTQIMWEGSKNVDLLEFG